MRGRRGSSVLFLVYISGMGEGGDTSTNIEGTAIHGEVGIIGGEKPGDG